MSFLSVFDDILKGIQAFSPLIQLGASFIPGGTVAVNIVSKLPSIIQAIQASIVNAEALHINEPKSGDLKKSEVVLSFEDQISQLTAIAKNSGKTVSYDAGKLSAFIDAQTASNNAGAALLQSIKIS